MAMLDITRWYHNWLPFVLIKPTSTADSRTRDPQKNGCEFFDVDPIFTWKIMKKTRNLVHFLGRTWRFFRGFQWSLRKAHLIWPRKLVHSTAKSDSLSNLKNSANFNGIQSNSHRSGERRDIFRGTIHGQWRQVLEGFQLDTLTRWRKLDLKRKLGENTTQMEMACLGKTAQTSLTSLRCLCGYGSIYWLPQLSWMGFMQPWMEFQTSPYKAHSIAGSVSVPSIFLWK